MERPYVNKALNRFCGHTEDPDFNCLNVNSNCCRDFLNFLTTSKINEFRSTDLKTLTNHAPTPRTLTALVNRGILSIVREEKRMVAILRDRKNTAIVFNNADDIPTDKCIRNIVVSSRNVYTVNYDILNKYLDILNSIDEWNTMVEEVLN